MYEKRNNKACSWNHCCGGKAMSITYSECVFVAVGTQHAMRMRHSLQWPWRALQYFYIIL